MPQLKRRHFLQLVGSAVTTASLNSCLSRRRRSSQNNLLRNANSNSGKLALLVGINAYPSNSQIEPLRGCLMDVELQRHLLIYRFGFNPKNILTLTDTEATRQGILQAFEEHLIKQAKPDDVVVFHYSGHGSQVADPDFKRLNKLNSTLVPADSGRPAALNQGGAVKDITEHTLFLLMTALKTQNVTAVLDCCYSGDATRGNLQIRSVRGGANFQASPEETEYQQRWLSQLKLTPDEFRQQRLSGVAKGVIIRAKNRDQLAADYPFNGFTAGIFTYLMSQYLWQQGNQSINKALPKIAQSTRQVSLSLQTPDYVVKPESANEYQPFYFIDEQVPSAEAVITKVDGSQVELWLGGVDAENLAAFNKNAIFAAVDADGQPSGRVQLESRQGLVGRGKLLKAVPAGVIQPGALCLEQVRSIPYNLSLRIGLDPSLGQDTAQAKAALSGLKRIETSPLRQGEVHYIFGRMTKTYRAEAIKRISTKSPAEGSWGLFSPGLDVISGSFGSPDETVMDAVKRLQAKLNSLLAAQMVKMTLNTDSLQLKMTASLLRVDQENQRIAQVFPTRGAGAQLIASEQVFRQTVSTGNDSASELAKLPLRTPVQLQIVNFESRDLYVSVLLIDPTGKMTVIFPNNWVAPVEASQISAGQILLIPDPSDDGFEFQTQEPKGMMEVLIFASMQPMRKTFKALQAIAKQRNQLSGVVHLSAPLEVIEDLLDDLGQGNAAGNRQGGSRGKSATSVGDLNVVARVDTTQLSAMSITFEVV